MSNASLPRRLKVRARTWTKKHLFFTCFSVSPPASPVLSQSIIVIRPHFAPCGARLPSRAHAILLRYADTVRCLASFLIAPFFANRRKVDTSFFVKIVTLFRLPLPCLSRSKPRHLAACTLSLCHKPRFLNYSTNLYPTIPGGCAKPRDSPGEHCIPRRGLSHYT